MYLTPSASNFFKTNNHSLGSTKKHTRLETINELFSMEVLDRQINQEKDRLIKSGANEVSKEYQELIDQRKLLESSPRFVGAFPSSPPQKVGKNMSEHHRRSPTDMIRGFLQQSPKEKSPKLFVAYGRKTQPMEMKAVADQLVEPIVEQRVEPTQVAYGLSVLRPLFILKHLDSQAPVETPPRNEPLGSSVASSLTDSQVSSSSYSDGEFSFSSVFGSYK